jgi:cardiolipin synthase
MLLKSLPNLLSFLRLILVIPFVYYFHHQSFHLAILIFIIAALTDALDGWLARILK